MNYKTKRKLKKLSNRQFAEDIKRYIKSSHDFYGLKVPELKTLGKRLSEEHSLKDFYKVFNKFWKSGYNEEKFLAIYTLQLYKDKFDINTWRFIKPKLKEIKSYDQIDSVSSEIIGHILLRCPRLEKEILKLSESNNVWLKRMAIVSTLPLIKNNNFNLIMKIAEKRIYDREESVQKLVGNVLKEIGEQDSEVLKKFILTHSDMPSIVFYNATENMRSLRKIRYNGVRKLLAWR